MGRNSGKGGKGQKKQRNKEVDTSKRSLLLKDSEALHEYAQIMKALGDRRFQVSCFDGQNRVAHIPGKFNKRMFFSTDDVVLVQLRDYQPDKVDIIHKYTSDEIRTLKKMGEIPSTAATAEADLNSDNDTEAVVFDDNNTLDNL